MGGESAQNVHLNVCASKLSPYYHICIRILI